MLTDQEKRLLLHFLSTIKADKKLKNISNNVTNGRIECKSREDAISSILMHSQSVMDILGTKAVNAHVLLNYLHEVKVEAPGNAEKDALLKYVFRMWGIQPPAPSVVQSNGVSSLSSSQNFAQLLAAPVGMNGMLSNNTNNSMQLGNTGMQTNQLMNQPLQSNTFVNSQTPLTERNLVSYNHNSQNMSMNANQLSVQQPQNGQTSLQLHQNSYLNQFQNTGQHLMSSNQHPQFPNQYPVQNQMQIQQKNESPYAEVVRSSQLLKEVNSLAFDEFILNFAKQFYELLNQNPNSQYLHGLSDSHFFTECRIQIMIKGGQEDIEQAGENIGEVLTLLSDIKREHQLMFNPNLSADGVRGKTDSHGLIYAVASGTLHQGRGQMVGVFEHSFILRKDPFDANSCKIAESTLILRSSNAVESISQLMLTSNKRTHGSQNLAIENSPSNRQTTSMPQITYVE